MEAESPLFEGSHAGGLRHRHGAMGCAASGSSRSQRPAARRQSPQAPSRAWLTKLAQTSRSVLRCAIEDAVVTRADPPPMGGTRSGETCSAPHWQRTA